MSPANNDQPAAYPLQDRPAGYPLRSRCLWCREPIGWDCPIGLWVHLRSDRVWCRDRVGAWAAADPQFTTITHRLLYTAGQGSDNRPTGVETT